jgi:hypothetical protein
VQTDEKKRRQQKADDGDSESEDDRSPAAIVAYEGAERIHDEKKLVNTKKPIVHTETRRARRKAH